jgi:hypothetical protein
MGKVFCRVVLGLGLAVLLAASASAESKSSAGLSSALDRQDAWLSRSGERGERWQSFLRTSSLRSELSQGANANRRAIARVLGRYQCNVAGLDHPNFRRTRRQLEAWSNELRVPLALRWAARAEAVSGSKHVITPDHVARAKSDLRDAVAQLDLQFASTDHDNAQAWKDFLKWDELQEQLQTDTPDWAMMGTLRDIYYSGHLGLELPEFVRVREALRQYHYVGVLSENPDNSEKILSAQLAMLSDSLINYNDAPSTGAAADVATLAYFLTNVGLVPDVASELRQSHGQPNLLVRVSENFLARRFAESVNETRPVNEMILQTHVRGNAHTTGFVTADVVPSTNGARVDIVMSGTTLTRSVGRQSPVTIHSASTTSIASRKGLVLHPRDILSEPARANCTTHTNIFSIVPDNRLGQKLIGKIAWKRAGQQKPITERIASHRAARRVEAQMDRRTEELLSRTRQTLQEQMRGPLDRRGLIPDAIHTSSNDTHVMLTALQAGATQLAAATMPNPFSADESIAARVHESAVNNTAQQGIAGLTLTDERIAELMQELTGSVPDELQPSAETAPWSISFDLQQPVTVKFDEESVTLAIRGRRFTSGDRVLDQNVMEISATYHLATSPTGAVLTRRGEIEVNFPGTEEDQRLSTSQIFFRTLMRNKFSALFTPVIEGKGIALPGRWKSIGTLRLSKLAADNGWLSLCWN